MGDPDDGSSALAIIQGYDSNGTPLGGTTGVANLVGSSSGAPYNSNTEPPELVWVSNPNISATTAVTSPQQFLLGSQMSSTGTSTSISPSGRWGIVPYPNIRFGFMRPGDNMIARRVPVLYQTALQTIEAQTAGTTVTRYPGMLANYILSVYEIPSQLPITGNANIQLGLNPDGSGWGDTSSVGNQVQISGSIYGDSVQLNGGTYSGGISSRNQVNVLASSSVFEENYTDNTYNNLGVREQRDLARQAGSAPVSVAGDNGKVMLVPVASGNAFYMPSVNATPTAWDLYSLPYYHCRIRITISGTNSNLNYFSGVFQTTGSSPGLVGAITVTISYLPDNAQQPDAVFGVPDNAPGWTTVTHTQVSNASNSASRGALTNTSTGLTANFLLYTSTATDTVDASASADTQDSNVLEIDLLQMYAALGLDPKYYYSIYIGCNPVQAPNGANNNYPGIVIKDADDLTGTTAAFAGTPPGPFINGLSIVSTQRIYVTGGANAIQQSAVQRSRSRLGFKQILSEPMCSFHL
jgi:hypothetical protein